jgi:hypothetical protein
MAQETLVSKHPRATDTDEVSAYQAPDKAGVTAKGSISIEESRRILGLLTESPVLSKRVEEIVDNALDGVKGLNKEDVFVTLIDINVESNGTPKFGHYSGNEMQVASGVGRLFWSVVALYNQERKGAKPSAALSNNIRKALQENNTAAINSVVNSVTGTQSGGELGKSALKDFATKRDIANVFYVCCLGFDNFNLNQKIWTGPPSPRDAQLLGDALNINYEASNRVTTNQTAALLYLLDRKAIVSPAASSHIVSLLDDSVEQRKLGALEGISAGLPVGSKIATVNGYNKMNYHEAAIITLPNGKHYILAVFTKYNKFTTYFLPLVSREVARQFMQATGDDDPQTHRYIPKLSGKN